MRLVRRHDLSPRVELIPLIDVVFLLLTFFIYSLIVMARVQVLPVELTPAAGGHRPDPGVIHALTLDADANIFLDRKPISLDELKLWLDELAAAPKPGKLVLAAQVQGQVDRLPLFLQVLQMIRDAGIKDLNIVGAEEPPKPNEPPPSE